MLETEIGTYKPPRGIFRLLNFPLAANLFVIFSRTYFLLALVVL